MKTTKIALKPYLEKIEQLCEPLGKDALARLLLELARNIAPEERTDFLHSILSHVSKGSKRLSVTPTIPEKKLLAQIGDLRQEILTRIQSIEDGSYWEDPDEDWQDSYYDDGDPDLLNDEQKATLTAFFIDGGHLFMAGNKKSAQEVYHALLSLVNEVEAYGFLPELNVDLREARARYARCVYESAPENKRVESMLAAMEADLEKSDMGGLLDDDFPLLQDVIDAETGALEDFGQFLPSWKKALEQKDFHMDRVADLCLEAAFLTEGVKAVANLARSWQAKQPRGYLSWLLQLEAGEDWTSLKNACQEVLNILPQGSDRRKAANYLIKTGKKLGENGVILEGYRERFRSQPDDVSLLDLAGEAARQQVREKELAEICLFLTKRQSGHSESALLVKALLMAGAVDEAFKLCKQNKAVGWSHGNATGLLFAGVLYLASGGHADCGLIRDMLRDYGECISMHSSNFDEPENETKLSGFQEIIRGLGLADPASLDLNLYRQWAETIGENRVNHIVSNKQRTAYDRAAKALAVLAEVMAATGMKKEALAFLQGYCKTRYNRHVAFRREVKQAVEQSRILRGMEAGL